MDPEINRIMDTIMIRFRKKKYCLVYKTVHTGYVSILQGFCTFVDGFCQSTKVIWGSDTFVDIEMIEFCRYRFVEDLWKGTFPKKNKKN